MILYLAPAIVALFVIVGLLFENHVLRKHINLLTSINTSLVHENVELEKKVLQTEPEKD